MSWLERVVRPKIRAIVGKPDVPDHLWHKCTSCGEMIFHRDYKNNLAVCPHCNHHGRVEANERLETLFDERVFTKIELPKAITDPLKFRDQKKYTDRLKEARSKTEENEAIVVAHGKMSGQNAVIAVFNFQFMGGSMGIAVGEAIVAAAELAVLQQAALIVIPASGGARMQEGILSLMQMARSTVAVQRVRDAKLPYIVLLTDPTMGGVTASFAMLGDITLAEPGTLIGFAGARVIQETIREKLPEGFQRAEYLLEHGMIDAVVDRKNLKKYMGNLVTLLSSKDKQGKKITTAWQYKVAAQ
jgi:acetyl-CoA carboxylase carboxyl transferase subunit beta